MAGTSIAALESLVSVAKALFPHEVSGLKIIPDFNYEKDFRPNTGMTDNLIKKTTCLRKQVY
jgi:hypothetical protein